MHAAHYSSLLPDIFRHRTTKVRIPLPKAILLDFHGTISERRWEDKVIYPYVKEALGGYLQKNWANDLVQKCLPGLRSESFEQRFKNKFDDAPVISEPTMGEDDAVEPKHLANEVSDFVTWQMNSKKSTRETQTIERLVWQDGLRNKKILTPIYDDVLPCVHDWHDTHKCSIFIISSLERDTLKLLFENTSYGNLDYYITDYICTKSGDKIGIDVYKRLYERVLANQKINPNLRDTYPNRVNEKSGSWRLSTKSSRSAKMISSPSFEGVTKSVLFLTDSGQEAKAASQVADGSAFDCLLVNRPGNRRIRTYYLSQFQYIERFDDVEFVR